MATLFAGLLLVGTALVGVTLAGASDRQNAAISQYTPVAPFADERGGDAQPNNNNGGNGNNNRRGGGGSDPGDFEVKGDGNRGGNGGGSGGGDGSGGSAEGELAFTGFNLLILVMIGLLLLLIGSMLLMRDRAEQRAELTT